MAKYEENHPRIQRIFLISTMQTVGTQNPGFGYPFHPLVFRLVYKCTFVLLYVARAYEHLIPNDDLIWKSPQYIVLAGGERGCSLMIFSHLSPDR